MSEILKVLNKRVELKSEVVELGLVQDMEKMVMSLKTELSKLNSSVSDIENVIKDAKSNYSKSESIMNKAQELESKAAQAFLDLGIPIPKERKLMGDLRQEILQIGAFLQKFKI